MLAIEPAPARDFLVGLPQLLPEPPKAIPVVSVHWERRGRP
jgi:aromatic ring-opening dioxygenase catalytic subunit (LigB family)